MNSPERVLLISADSHASAFPETYRPYIEARYAERIDDLETEGVLYPRLYEEDEPVSGGDTGHHRF